MDVTRTLARYLVSSRYEDIPQRVRDEAARALLNWLGCAIGASRHETVERALAAVREFAGPPQATVLGRSERLDILNAAFVNAVSSHVLDFDDTHARAVHPSAPVLPALLAFAEWRKVRGQELVHAFVLGVEAECRIGLSVFPEHYDAGWHITGTAGVFGAAAAAVVHGAAGEPQFSDACVRDPRVTALRGRVSASADASIRKTEARVTIRTRDGRTLSRHVEHALGTFARPMSDADLEAKFRGLAAEVLPAARIAELITLCWNIAGLDDAGTLACAAAAAAG